ncbi:MAG: hypothetical protein VX916_02770 [Planctomycetota bacterium]|nr:hypothetical protein [Planctomycetota bacterium]
MKQTVRKKGAESIRGSLGAYARAAVTLVVLMALWSAYWIASTPDRTTEVYLPPKSGVRLASLDDGRQQVALSPGEKVSVRPGQYRLVWEVTEARPVSPGFAMEITVDGDVVNLEELIEQFVEDGARSDQARN